MRKPTSMVALAHQYLDYRHKLGFLLRVEGPQVAAFAEYADESKHQGPITTELAVQWARLPQNVSPLYHARRLEVVRCFARYAAIFDDRTEIPPEKLLGQAHRRIQPHIYSDEEIRRLMKAAGELSPVDGLRPRTYTVLFGVLASTGLRISEALRLRQVDVDLHQSLMRIVETKFRKSRLVVLHPTVCDRVQAYACFRNRHRHAEHSDAFFLAESGRALNYSTVRTTFRRIVRRLGWDSPVGKPRPRIYDLRHTFACHRLLQWYREGVDVDHAIAALSTYMGHVRVTDTYWYLTGIPDLLQVAADRFENFRHNHEQESLS